MATSVALLLLTLFGLVIVQWRNTLSSQEWARILQILQG